MFYQSTLSDFNRQLNEIQKANTEFLDQANLGYDLCTKTLGLLRKMVEAEGFKTIKEEIHFFKYGKVEPMKYLIHYTKVRSFELRMPKIGTGQKLKYLERQIEKVNTFFGRYTEFLLYMEQEYTHFDEHYFTRKHLVHRQTVKSYPYYKDPLFNTSYDEIWARITGLALYVNYLKKKKGELEAIKNNDALKKTHGKLSWTGSYAAFVEFVYGCQAMGYFNDGNVDTNKVIEALSNFLNIEKGNPSRTYNEIKARKGSRIKFFEETGQKLLRKMDDEDGLDS